MAETGTDIEKAAALLQQGHLVAIPTETVYGLAANALNPEAVAKIFAAKNRPSFNPLIIHCASVEAALAYTSKLPELAGKLLKAFAPGPITVLVPKSHLVPDIVTAGSPLVALRIPNHPLTLQLLKSLPFPVAAPSANPFGYISPTTAAHVNAQLGNKVGYILDGGSSSVGLESTIIGFNAQGKGILLREGGLAREEVEKISGPLENGKLKSATAPQAPGMLSSHYAPKASFLLFQQGQIPARYTQMPNTGALRFSQLTEGIPGGYQRVLSATGNMNEAAANLFKYLRELDALGLDLIVAEQVPDEGLGRAINDRLKRAAAQ